MKQDVSGLKRQRVLFICNDAIGANMAGPGVRYWEFARALGRYFAVTLAVPPFVQMEEEALVDAGELPATIRLCKREAELRTLVTGADVVVTLSPVPVYYPFLAEAGVPLVIDMYDPFLLASLHVGLDCSLEERLALVEGYRCAHISQGRMADFIICASEKQRDYWLGQLTILGRINPYTHDDDQTLRRLIDVVPFGLPGERPQHTRSVLKGVYPGITADDKVILWNGGIWDWFDALTLVKSMARIAQQRTDVKLVFAGIKRPGVTLAQERATRETIALTRELNLYNRGVFFNDWVPYQERQNFLLESDVGVSVHLDHVEGRFSFRSRFLDFIWAGLPIVATRGDVMSDLVAAHGLGRTVPPRDVDALTHALLELLDTPNLRQTLAPRFEQVAAAYRWDVVVGPLIEFCANPRFAPDRPYLSAMPMAEAAPTPWWALAGKAWQALCKHGAAGLLRQVRQYLRWKQRT
jgi:glycosyltransferase involved in cell wall biosynthesis